jgi:hypothetical protein
VQDLTDSDENARGKPAAWSRDAELRSRFERLRILQSAWGVLAPSGLSEEKQAIAETGRALSEDLKALLGEQASRQAPSALAALDAGLHELEREMREVALKVPVPQLRSTLPDRVAVDRRGVLDLLDLVLGAEIAGLNGTGERIPTFDYLISLLCTGGSPDAPLQDPVTLTPRLHDLCARSEVDYDPRLPELEAEFFAAADMHQAEVREEIEQRTLRRRKMELGSAFFAPRVLRAIMTYNAALLRRVDEEALSSQDWGELPSVEEADESACSVFETAALPKLARALRRRAADDPPAHDPIDRIAWCLDLASLDPQAREALLAEPTGRREGLKGPTVLVGLLCRSAVVLDEEYPAIGISPRQLAGAWALELGNALQQEVNRRITSDDYDGACALSDLKSKFLNGSDPMARASRPRAQPRPLAPERSRDSSRAEASRIVSEALAASPTAERSPLRDLPWKLIAALATGGLFVALTVALAYTHFWDAGRVAGGELAALSPYLLSGTRSDEGVGRAFVGTLDAQWSRLESAEQTLEADHLVEVLRELGVREIMIYDGDRRLRIQALGAQPARIIAAPAGS